MKKVACLLVLFLVGCSSVHFKDGTRVTTWGGIKHLSGFNYKSTDCSLECIIEDLNSNQEDSLREVAEKAKETAALAAKAAGIP